MRHFSQPLTGRERWCLDCFQAQRAAVFGAAGCGCRAKGAGEAVDMRCLG